MPESIFLSQLKDLITLIETSKIAVSVGKTLEEKAKDISKEVHNTFIFDPNWSSTQDPLLVEVPRGFLESNSVFKNRFYVETQHTLILKSASNGSNKLYIPCTQAIKIFEEYLIENLQDSSIEKHIPEIQQKITDAQNSCKKNREKIISQILKTKESDFFDLQDELGLKEKVKKGFLKRFVDDKKLSQIHQKQFQTSNNYQKYLTKEGFLADIDRKLHHLKSDKNFLKLFNLSEKAKSCLFYIQKLKDKYFDFDTNPAIKKYEKLKINLLDHYDNHSDIPSHLLNQSIFDTSDQQVKILIEPQVLIEACDTLIQDKLMDVYHDNMSEKHLPLLKEKIDHFVQNISKEMHHDYLDKAISLLNAPFDTPTSEKVKSNISLTEPHFLRDPNFLKELAEGLDDLDKNREKNVSELIYELNDRYLPKDFLGRINNDKIEYCVKYAEILFKLEEQIRHSENLITDVSSLIRIDKEKLLSLYSKNLSMKEFEKTYPKYVDFYYPYIINQANIYCLKQKKLDFENKLMGQGIDYSKLNEKFGKQKELIFLETKKPSIVQNIPSSANFEFTTYEAFVSVTKTYRKSLDQLKKLHLHGPSGNNLDEYVNQYIQHKEIIKTLNKFDSSISSSNPFDLSKNIKTVLAYIEKIEATQNLVYVLQEKKNNLKEHCKELVKNADDRNKITHFKFSSDELKKKYPLLSILYNECLFIEETCASLSKDCAKFEEAVKHQNGNLHLVKTSLSNNQSFIQNNGFIKLFREFLKTDTEIFLISQGQSAYFDPNDKTTSFDNYCDNLKRRNLELIQELNSFDYESYSNKRKIQGHVTKTIHALILYCNSFDNLILIDEERSGLLQEVTNKTALSSKEMDDFFKSPKDFSKIKDEKLRNYYLQYQDLEQQKKEAASALKNAETILKSLPPEQLENLYFRIENETGVFILNHNFIETLHKYIQTKIDLDSTIYFFKKDRQAMDGKTGKPLSEKIDLLADQLDRHKTELLVHDLKNLDKGEITFSKQMEVCTLYGRYLSDSIIFTTHYNESLYSLSLATELSREQLNEHITNFLTTGDASTNFDILSKAIPKALEEDLQKTIQLKEKNLQIEKNIFTCKKAMDMMFDPLIVKKFNSLFYKKMRDLPDLAISQTIQPLPNDLIPRKKTVSSNNVQFSNIFLDTLKKYITALDLAEAAKSLSENNSGQTVSTKAIEYMKHSMAAAKLKNDLYKLLPENVFQQSNQPMKNEAFLVKFKSKDPFDSAIKYTKQIKNLSALSEMYSSIAKDNIKDILEQNLSNDVFEKQHPNLIIDYKLYLHHRQMLSETLSELLSAKATLDSFNLQTYQIESLFLPVDKNLSEYIKLAEHITRPLNNIIDTTALHIKNLAKNQDFIQKMIDLIIVNEQLSTFEAHPSNHDKVNTATGLTNGEVLKNLKEKQVQLIHKLNDFDPDLKKSDRIKKLVEKLSPLGSDYNSSVAMKELSINLEPYYISLEAVKYIVQIESLEKNSSILLCNSLDISEDELPLAIDKINHGETYLNIEQSKKLKNYFDVLHTKKIILNNFKQIEKILQESNIDGNVIEKAFRKRFKNDYPLYSGVPLPRSFFRPEIFTKLNTHLKNHFHGVSKLNNFGKSVYGAGLYFSIIDACRVFNRFHDRKIAEGVFYTASTLIGYFGLNPNTYIYLGDKAKGIPALSRFLKFGGEKLLQSKGAMYAAAFFMLRDAAKNGDELYKEITDAYVKINTYLNKQFPGRKKAQDFYSNTSIGKIKHKTTDLAIETGSTVFNNTVRPAFITADNILSYLKIFSTSDENLNLRKPATELFLAQYQILKDWQKIWHQKEKFIKAQEQQLNNYVSNRLDKLTDIEKRHAKDETQAIRRFVKQQLVRITSGFTFDMEENVTYYQLDSNNQLQKRTSPYFVLLDTLPIDKFIGFKKDEKKVLEHLSSCDYDKKNQLIRKPLINPNLDSLLSMKRIIIEVDDFPNPLIGVDKLGQNLGGHKTVSDYLNFFKTDRITGCALDKHLPPQARSFLIKKYSKLNSKNSADIKKTALYNRFPEYAQKLYFTKVFFLQDRSVPQDIYHIDDLIETKNTNQIYFVHLSSVGYKNLYTVRNFSGTIILKDRPADEVKALQYHSKNTDFYEITSDFHITYLNQPIISYTSFPNVGIATRQMATLESLLEKAKRAEDIFVFHIDDKAIEKPYSLQDISGKKIIEAKSFKELNHLIASIQQTFSKAIILSPAYKKFEKLDCLSLGKLTFEKSEFKEFKNSITSLETQDESSVFYLEKGKVKGSYSLYNKQNIIFNNRSLGEIQDYLKPYNKKVTLYFNPTSSMNALTLSLDYAKTSSTYQNKEAAQLITSKTNGIYFLLQDFGKIVTMIDLSKGSIYRLSKPKDIKFHFEKNGIDKASNSYWSQLSYQEKTNKLFSVSGQFLTPVENKNDLLEKLSIQINNQKITFNFNPKKSHFDQIEDILTKISTEFNKEKPLVRKEIMANTKNVENKKIDNRKTLLQSNNILINKN